jgi:hypothetical protein
MESTLKLSRIVELDLSEHLLGCSKSRLYHLPVGIKKYREIMENIEKVVIEMESMHMFSIVEPQSRARSFNT